MYPPRYMHKFINNFLELTHATTNLQMIFWELTHATLDIGNTEGYVCVRGETKRYTHTKSLRKTFKIARKVYDKGIYK